VFDNPGRAEPGIKREENVKLIWVLREKRHIKGVEKGEKERAGYTQTPSTVFVIV
jgi:hypothetical protein